MLADDAGCDTKSEYAYSYAAEGAVRVFLNTFSANTRRVGRSPLVSISWINIFLLNSELFN